MVDLLSVCLFQNREPKPEDYFNGFMEVGTLEPDRVVVLDNVLAERFGLLSLDSSEQKFL